MSAKSCNQHEPLHQMYGYNDCCLCRAEKKCDDLQRKLDIAVEALENIVQFHDGYCEHHINVSQHSYDLSNIAHEALKKIKEK